MKRSPLRRKPEDPAARAFRVAVRARCRGRCEVGSPVCWGQTDPSFIHAHHIAGRGSHDPVGNGLGACPPCHSYIHANPAIAYEQGWMRHRNGEVA